MYCPTCGEKVTLIADNLYNSFLPLDWYEVPTHWVIYPCKHEFKELWTDDWGVVRGKPLEAS